MEQHYCYCKYNNECHETRQYVQSLIRAKDPHKVTEECDFYRYKQEKEDTT